MYLLSNTFCLYGSLVCLILNYTFPLVPWWVTKKQQRKQKKATSWPYSVRKKKSPLYLTPQTEMKKEVICYVLWKEDDDGGVVWGLFSSIIALSPSRVIALQQLVKKVRVFWIDLNHINILLGTMCSLYSQIYSLYIYYIYSQKIVFWNPLNH